MHTQRVHTDSYNHTLAEKGREREGGERKGEIKKKEKKKKRKKRRRKKQKPLLEHGRDVYQTDRQTDRQRDFDVPIGQCVGT